MYIFFAAVNQSAIFIISDLLTKQQPEQMFGGKREKETEAIPLLSRQCAIRMFLKLIF